MKFIHKKIMSKYYEHIETMDELIGKYDLKEVNIIGVLSDVHFFF